MVKNWNKLCCVWITHFGGFVKVSGLVKKIGSFFVFAGAEGEESVQGLVCLFNKSGCFGVSSLRHFLISRLVFLCVLFS